MAEQLTGLLPIFLIIAVGYLLIIRPARKRQRDLLSVQQQLSPGVRVMTTSGLYATVREVTDSRIVLETSPGIRSTWARNAVSRIDAETPASGPDRAVDLTDATRDGAVRETAVSETAAEETAARDATARDATAGAASEPGADTRRTDDRLGS